MGSTSHGKIVSNAENGDRIEAPPVVLITQQCNDGQSELVHKMTERGAIAFNQGNSKRVITQASK